MPTPQAATAKQDLGRRTGEILMDAVLKVVGTIGAIWLLVSILVAIFWGLAGRKIFRKPPAPPTVTAKPWVNCRAVGPGDMWCTKRVYAEIARWSNFDSKAGA